MFSDYDSNNFITSRSKYCTTNWNVSSEHKECPGGGFSIRSTERSVVLLDQALIPAGCNLVGFVFNGSYTKIAN